MQHLVSQDKALFRIVSRPLHHCFRARGEGGGRPRFDSREAARWISLILVDVIYVIVVSVTDLKHILNLDERPH